MKAFVERLCDHAGIVRAGPQAEKYGDPYDYACPYLIQGGTAVLKALVTDGKLSIAHVRAAFRALRKEGLTPKWERIKQ